MQISEQINVCHEAAKAKGFWDSDRNTGELLMLCVSELAEALEAHRKGRMCQNVITELNNEKNDLQFKHLFGNYVKDTFQDEITDTVIRLFDLCGGLGIDLESHITAKLRFNSMRERLHGKAY